MKHARDNSRPRSAGRSRARQAKTLVLGLVTAVFGGLAAGSAADAAPAIRSILASAEAGYTRVVIDLTDPPSFTYAVLPANPKHDAPGRLYIDLKNVRLPRGKDLGTWIGDSRVRRVRTGQYTATTARIVLELEGTVTAKVIGFESPPRVVVDLTGKGGTPAGPSVAERRAAEANARAAAPTPAKPAQQAAAPRRVSPPAQASARVTGTATGRVPQARRIRVVIDPGHGGKDPGARGPGGLEKDSVLDISRRLAAKLRSRLGIEVYMTRSDDRFVELDARKDLANRLEADLFVSVHANASESSKMRGIETYYLKNTDDRATLRLAKLENGVNRLIKGSDVSSDADLSYILSDIIQGQKEADSILLANHIQAELCGHLGRSYDSVRSLGVKQGPFLVLDGTYMPSVLVEAGFITNAGEGQRLRSSAYRDAIAEGLYHGIKRYLEDERVDDLT